MTKQALLIMAKRPAEGQTKTRLCPPLTHAQGAALYECFLKDVLDIVRTVQKLRPSVQPCIAYSPADAHDYFAQLAPDFELVAQVGDTLGERLDHVLRTCLDNGYKHVAAINSDSPTLPADILAQAFAVLAGETGERVEEEKVDAVFGPCEDGGYYLIGIDRPQPRLVREVEMSTATVLQDTLALAEEDNLRVRLLPRWYDVDTEDELTRLYEELMTTPATTGTHTRALMKEFYERRSTI